MKTFSLGLFLALSVCLHSFGRNVMSWIPVYGISTAKANLNDATRSQWIKNGVTHIGLQFWVPGDAGATVFVTDYQYTYKASTISQDVQDIVSWGNTNGVKVMLCFHNVRSGDFDWTLAQQVFNDYPNETVSSIMTIINNYGLDGVDIDFEGTGGDYTSDKPAYVNFLDTLGRALHAAGKQLSIDMFSTPCYNSPNPSWESAMAPHVDFMNIMGYTDTYESNNTLFSYCPQTPSETNSYPFRYSYIEDYLTIKQNVASSLLNYGLPGWADSWGGQCVQENILDIMDISTAGGIAIWDLQLSGGGFWTDPITWDLIRLFKNDYSSEQVRSQLASICGTPTAIEDAVTTANRMYYDAANQLIHLPGLTGHLYLYSTNGILERNWDIKSDEEVSVIGLQNGFYLVRFETPSGVFTNKIAVFK